MKKGLFKKDVPVVEKNWFYYIKFQGKYEFIPKNWYGKGYDYLFDKNSISFDFKPDILTKKLSVVYCYLFIIFMHLVYAIYLIFYPFFIYIDGAKNFIKNGVWANNIRFFSWINFIGVILYIISTIFLLIKIKTC